MESLNKIILVTNSLYDGIDDQENVSDVRLNEIFSQAIDTLKAALANVDSWSGLNNIAWRSRFLWERRYSLDNHHRIRSSAIPEWGESFETLRIILDQINTFFQGSSAWNWADHVGGRQKNRSLLDV